MGNHTRDCEKPPCDRELAGRGWAFNRRVCGQHGRSLYLTNGGVNQLRSCGYDAQTGYDPSISGAYLNHRTLGTAYLIVRAASGRALGEYALCSTRSKYRYGALAEHFNKRPDGLVLVPGETRGYDKVMLAADWIEVEAGFKPKDELNAHSCDRGESRMLPPANQQEQNVEQDV